jgi:hypothetical protein
MQKSSLEFQRNFKDILLQKRNNPLSEEGLRQYYGNRAVTVIPEQDIKDPKWAKPLHENISVIMNDANDEDAQNFGVWPSLIHKQRYKNLSQFSPDLIDKEILIRGRDDNKYTKTRVDLDLASVISAAVHKKPNIPFDSNLHNQRRVFSDVYKDKYDEQAKFWNFDQ